MRDFLIVGNWKENKTIKETVDWFKDFWVGLERLESVEVVVCPPFTNLATLKNLFRETPLKVGAQDVSQHESGAYTGEISSAMLEGLVDYALIGHSERRRFFGENNQIVAQKVKLALGKKIVPVVCISDIVDKEGVASLEGEFNEEYFLNQIHEVFRDLTEVEKNTIIFGYEPPSAISKQVGPIGVGKAAPVEEVGKMVRKIKEIASQNKVIYGGSVKSDNVLEFFNQEEIDGVLPGSASLNPEEFRKMIVNVENSNQ